jgi:hypothetical protein
MAATTRPEQAMEGRCPGRVQEAAGRRQCWASHAAAGQAAAWHAWRRTLPGTLQQGAPAPARDLSGAGLAGGPAAAGGPTERSLGAAAACRVRGRRDRTMYQQQGEQCQAGPASWPRCLDQQEGRGRRRRRRRGVGTCTGPGGTHRGGQAIRRHPGPAPAPADIELRVRRVIPSRPASHTARREHALALGLLSGNPGAQPLVGHTRPIATTRSSPPHTKCSASPRSSSAR